MAVAVANVRGPNGELLYRVTGVDRNTPQGLERVQALSRGKFPFTTTDTTLHQALSLAHSCGNLSATTDESVYATADVVVVDVALDIPFLAEKPQLDLVGLEKSVTSIAEKIPNGGLVLIETTVPPGTCENVLAPILRKEAQRRGLAQNSIHLAHSFERVMPGEAYLESITHFWRVYAGHTSEAANVCEEFLSSIVDIKHYPLTRLSSMTASETAKVMENTYRAANIAFIDEWTKYAEAVGIDLYEVIDAIQMRPTHANIRFPGLGVGGYCLTKDPAFAPLAAHQLFSHDHLEFPFSRLAMQVNRAMPEHAVSRLESLLNNGYRGKRVLVLGVSYRQNVGDTRYSPVETFVRALEICGAQVTGFDPFVDYWPEMSRSIASTLPEAKHFDAVVIATPHREFFDLEIIEWFNEARPLLLDTANVLSKEQRQRCRKVGIRVESLGRGDSL